jgi:hypothetical protein
MKKLPALALLLVFVSLTWSGCTSDKDYFDRLERSLTYSARTEFEQVMLSFIADAEGGDVDGMLALTSNVTIQQAGGLEKIREFYRTNLVPTFKRFPNLVLGGTETFGKDEYGKARWTFKRIFRSADGREARLQFGVEFEEAKEVVFSVEPWK